MATGSTDLVFPRSAILIALLVALLFVVGAVYKWVDEEGKVHYSDKPPARAVRRRPVPVAPRPDGGGQQRTQAEAALAGAPRSRRRREAAARESMRVLRTCSRRSASEHGRRQLLAALAVQVCADARVQRMTLDLQHA